VTPCIYAAKHHARNTGQVQTNPNIEMQRKINGNDREDVKIHTEALRKFYSALYMIMAVMGEIHSMHLEKENEDYTEEIALKRNRIWRPRHRWKDNIKWIKKEQCESSNLIKMFKEKERVHLQTAFSVARQPVED
jgi:hypothetical protein